MWIVFSDAVVAAQARAELEKKHSGLLVPAPPAPKVEQKQSAVRAAATRGDGWDEAGAASTRPSAAADEEAPVKQNWDDPEPTDRVCTIRCVCCL